MDSSAPLSTTLPPETPKKKKGSGCFVTGCFTVIIFLVLMVAGTYLAFRQLTKGVMEYASDTPAAIETIDIGPGEVDAIRAKMDNFTTEVLQGNKPETLEISSRELNALIQHTLENELKLQRFPTRAVIQDGHIKLESSFPLTAIMKEKLYLNISAVVSPTYDGQILSFNPNSITIGGKSVDAEWLQGHRVPMKYNFSASKDANVRQLAQIIEKIEVSGDKLLIFPRMGSTEVSVHEENVFM